MKEAILIVEDDVSIAKGLEKNLRFEGYSVFVAPDGDRGLELAANKSPDLVLLDVMLPKMNGFEVLREIRRCGMEMPVIMLTAKGEEIDKVRGLELGADDYVTKPFGLHELLARIEAVLRRKRRFEKNLEMVKFGNITVDKSARKVLVDGKECTCTSREFDLLLFFLARENQAVDRQEILNKVWGLDYFGTDRTVDNFINRLRQKIEPDPDNPIYILTVRGLGYRFQRSFENHDNDVT